MDITQALRTVDTVTRVMRKTQLMIKDAPKVSKILTEYKLDRMYAAKTNNQKPITIKSRNRFKPIEL